MSNGDHRYSSVVTTDEAEREARAAVKRWDAFADKVPCQVSPLPEGQPIVTGIAFRHGDEPCSDKLTFGDDLAITDAETAEVLKELKDEFLRGEVEDDDHCPTEAEIEADFHRLCDRATGFILGLIFGIALGILIMWGRTR